MVKIYCFQIRSSLPKDFQVKTDAHSFVLFYKNQNFLRVALLGRAIIIIIIIILETYKAPKSIKIVQRRCDSNIIKYYTLGGRDGI